MTTRQQRRKPTLDGDPVEFIRYQLTRAHKTLAMMEAAPDVMGGNWKIRMIAHWQRRVYDLEDALDAAMDAEENRKG